MTRPPSSLFESLAVARLPVCEATIRLILMLIPITNSAENAIISHCTTWRVLPGDTCNASFFMKCSRKIMLDTDIEIAVAALSASPTDK